jgi:TonB-linked SusC/RagA family outer membrane protein
MKKISFFLCCLVLGIGLATAQTKEVTGTVISDEDGEPVIGATVMVKGTSLGTVTDFDGAFTLSVPTDVQKLSISYVGMVPKDVDFAPVIHVRLQPDTQLLTEVVVTGYGVTRKVAFTGSAQMIGDEVIKKTTDADPIRALQGSVAGFQMSSETGQPGGFNTVLIRGLGSFNSGTQPLYVIDGVPMTSGKFGMRKSENATINPLSGLNPNDIESMSILKDATATSIYGARAANGVIVITTKSGQSGKTKVNILTKLGAAMQPPRKDYRMLNAGEWNDFMVEILGNSKLIKKGDEQAAKEFITSPKGLGLEVDPQADTDWYKEVTRSGFTQEYNVDLSGGTEKTRFFLSGAYYDEVGTVIGKDMKRYAGRLNLENQINSHVSAGINVSASYALLNYGAGGGYFSDPLTQSLMQLPVQAVRKADGSWNMNTVNGYNPVAQRSEKGDKNIGKQIKAIVSPWARVNFLNDFTYISRYGLDYYNIKEFGLWSMLQPQGNDMNMLGEEGNTNTTLWTWTNTLNWMKTYKSHHLNILLGQELQQANEDISRLSGSNYPTDGVFTVENAATPVSAATSIRNYALASAFLNAEYDFDNTYYLSGSLRRDGSSRFGKNNRWATFWSVGLKYRIINEKFMEGFGDWLSNLTLRASYGTTGNQDIDWYQARGLYRFGYSYLKNPGMFPAQIANPDLKWEQTGKFNVGMEVVLFDALTIDFDYYDNLTSDMLFNVPLSKTTGFAYLMKNIGKMRNTGFEAVIGYTPIRKKDFQWNVSLNLTHNKNRIVRLETDQPIEGTYTIREAGRPYHTFKMKEYAGVDPQTGEQLWYKGETGKETTKSYNEAGKRYLGEADPKLYGGLTNTFQLHDFDLSFQLNYSLGGKVYNNAARYDENTNSLTGNTTLYVYKNMWKKPGDQTNVPAPLYGSINNHSSRYLMDGSYIKIQNIQLGYNLPKNLLRHVSIEGLRLFVSGENLSTWTLSKDFRGLNPEAGMDGILWWNYPLSRKLLFGLSIHL